MPEHSERLVNIAPPRNRDDALIMADRGNGGTEAVTGGSGSEYQRWALQQSGYQDVDAADRTRRAVAALAGVAVRGPAEMIRDSMAIEPATLLARCQVDSSRDPIVVFSIGQSFVVQAQRITHTLAKLDREVPREGGDGRAELSQMKDRLIERALDLYIDAFPRTNKDFDYVVAGKINAFDELGAGEKFPEKLNRLMEIAMNMRVGKSRFSRHEFFDGYLKLNKDRGELERVIRFIEANFEIFLKMDLEFSTAFSELGKKVPEMDNVRYELIRRKFREFEQETKAAGGVPAFGAGGRIMIKEYITIVCVMVDGNYAEARRVYNKYREFLVQENPTDEVHDTTGQGAGRGEAWDDSAEHRVNEIERAIEQLIPPLIGRQMILRHGAESSQAATVVIERERAAIRAILGRSATELRSGADPSVGNALDLIKAQYADERVGFNKYYNGVVGYWRAFLPEDAIDARHRMVVLLAALLAHKMGEIRIPAEIKSVLIANYFAYAYDNGDLTVAGDSFKYFCRGDFALGCPVARGTAFYFFKAFYDLPETTGPASMIDEDHEIPYSPAGIPDWTDESLEAGGTAALPVTKEVACDFLFENIKKFEGSAHEVELWRDYFVPRFDEFKERLFAAYTLAKVLKVIEVLLAEGNTHPDLSFVVICFLVRSDRDLEKGRELMVTLRNSGNEARVRPALLMLFDKMMAIGKVNDAIALMREFAGGDFDQKLGAKLCSALLNPIDLNKARLAEAQSMIAGHPEMAGEFEAKILRAREILRIVEYSEVPFGAYADGRLGEAGAVKRFGGDDLYRMLYLFERGDAILEASSSAMREVFEEGDVMKLVEGRHVFENGFLRETFGIEELKFAPVEEGGFEISCVFVGEMEVDKNVFALDVDKDFQFADAEIEDDGRSYALKRTIAKTLQAAVMEYVLNFLQDVDLNETEGAFATSSSSYSAFCARMEGEMANWKREHLKMEGMEGLKERNAALADRIRPRLADYRETADFPSDVEVKGFIGRYLHLIRNCRDLDAPGTCYRSGVAKSDPFYEHLKYLKIYGPEFAKKRLADMGLCEGEIAEADRFIERRNNLAGFYEIACVFEDLGEVNFAVFLDEDGRLVAPGIEQDDELYEHLWLIVLECLVKKVVPEMESYAHVFKQRGSGENRAIKKLSMRRVGQEDALTSRKRMACSALVLRAKEAKSGRRPKHRLAVLDGITEAFNNLELGGKPLEEWPLYYKDGKRYKSALGLIFKHEGKNYVDVQKVYDLLEDEESFHFLDTSYVDDRLVVDFDKLPDDLKRSFQENILVKTLDGRVYRMPVKIEEQKYEIRVIDGEEFYLVPCAVQSDPHGRYVPIGDQFYRLKKVPKHTKFEIGGKSYMAIPDQMTQGQREIYEETPRIEADLAGRKVVYSLLIDEKSGEILAYRYLGPADRDEGGNYVDSRVKRHKAVAASGGLGIMQSRNIRREFGERGDVKEMDLEIETSMGYRQGVFPPVWKYLTSERDTKDVALRMILDLMKAKLTSEAYVEFAENLRREREEKADSAVKTPKEGAAKSPDDASHVGARKLSARELRRERMREFDTEAVYVFDIHAPEDLRMRYGGFETDEFMVLDANHPRYETIAMTMNLRRDEVIILVLPRGLPAKIDRGLLVRKGH